MNRSDFQVLAQIRLDEARSLLASGFFDGAYYLAGYAVECALKACIARRTAQHDFPPLPSEVQRMYTHRLIDLVRVADLERARTAERSRDPAFARFWTVVEDWSEQSRYERHSQVQAIELLEAVSDSQHGVLRWIQGFW